MSGRVIDRVDIHRQIWESRNRRGIVKIYQKAFAVHLKITAPQMSRIIHELIDQGRIKKIGSRYRNVGVYTVEDPANFVHSNGLGAVGANLGEK